MSTPPPKKNLAPKKVLSGFLDLLPAQARAFHELTETLTQVYKRYGYTPIDAPCIYLTETLAAESGGDVDKQLYRWQQGSRDVALRFDLTVPLARYVATHENTLNFPFKRYHCGKVWRGERPQKGRFREFYQLDFDIVGTDSPTADLEVALVIHDSLAALGLDDFAIHMNDRLLLNGVLASFGLEARAADVLRVVDKLDKVGRDGVAKELSDHLDLDAGQIQKLLAFSALGEEFAGHELLARLARDHPDNERVQRGVARLSSILTGAEAVLSEGRLVIDPAIARGLGYYTGPVFETFLGGQRALGSVCSGGRYDDLAGAFTKRSLPGVGASVGLSRLLAALEERGGDGAARRGVATLIMLLPGVAPVVGVTLRQQLHAAGLEAELYPQPPASWSKQSSAKAQLRYASNKGVQVGLMIGPDEAAAGLVQLKNLTRREQRAVNRDQLVEALRRELGA